MFIILMLIFAGSHLAIASDERSTVTPDQPSGQGICGAGASVKAFTDDTMHDKKVMLAQRSGHKVGASPSSCCSDKNQKCMYDCGKTKVDEPVCLKKCGLTAHQACHCMYAWGFNSVASGGGTNIQMAKNDCRRDC